MTKNELATALKDLGVELTAAQIKKATKDELAAMHQQALDASDEKVLFEPGDEAKPIKKGTKQHLLAKALMRGATVDEMAAATGWARQTISSGMSSDIKSKNLGVRRRGDRYFLILPAGVTDLPLR